MSSPYEILGVDADADDAEVLEAYRERVKEAHPDQGGSTAEFQAVKTAYERIKSGYQPSDDADGSAEPTPSRNGHRNRAADAGPTSSPDPEPDPEPDGRVVEYLNYEVMMDHGWELSEDDLFEKAAALDLDEEDYGRLVVDDNETLLEAAEEAGYAWPFACRGGACTNCAVAVIEGEVPKPKGHILPPDMIERGIRLSCLAAPTTGESKIVYNVKHLPGVEDLLLSATRFEKSRSVD
ncbi:2Fe-2S iron-sulfur cluster binding domain-containing protein [Halapricum sp. CBA1109]|uniref:ferredoxin Fer n=1 Tax=Halapricum sp. CBA1109 TaxID=2668068 RepID=UPI0013B8ABB5|nr:2Fe-2S iron-sulfur cluster binding domain-containing protein [Halapricum sp. CBA1109]